MNTSDQPGPQRVLRQALTEHGVIRLAILFGAAGFLPFRNRILAERRQAWIGR